MRGKYPSEVYRNIGAPDIGSVMYMIKKNSLGKKMKVWGKVTMVSYVGFKGASKGLVLLQIDPFEKPRRTKVRGMCNCGNKATEEWIITEKDHAREITFCDDCRPKR